MLTQGLKRENHTGSATPPETSVMVTKVPMPPTASMSKSDTGGSVSTHGIDVDAALDQLIFPPTPTVNEHLRKAYVTSTYDFLRSNPGNRILSVDFGPT